VNVTLDAEPREGQPAVADPPSVQRYVLGWLFRAVLATALVVLTGQVGRGLTGLSAGRYVGMAVMAALVAVAYCSAVTFRYGRSKQSVDLTEAALVPVFVLAPVGSAFLVAVAGVWLGTLARRDGAVKTAFNGSVGVVSAAVAVLVQLSVLGHDDPLSNRGLIATALALTAYGAVGFLAVSGVISRLEGQALHTVMRRRRHILTGTIGNIAIGLIGMVLWNVRPELLFLLVVPLVATSLAYRGASTTSHLTGQMQTEHDRLVRVVQATSDGIALVDGAGRVVLWNPALARLTGRDHDTAVGTPVSEVVPLRDSRERRPLDIGAVVATTRDTGVPIELDADLVEAGSGEHRAVRVSATAVDGDGDPASDGGLLVVRDTSREREVERLKDDFLMRVSHELRTPLTPIKGYAESLRMHRDRTTPELLDTSLARIVERSDHMAALIDDLLLVASLQRGGGLAADASLEPVDAAARARAAVASVADDRPCEVVDEAGLRCHADQARVDRILKILVDNAVTYSAAGSPVRIVVRASGSETAIDVIDRGRGIPRSHLVRIFDRFHRVEDPLVMTTNGLGIGLHIARHLARSMGGDIVVDSVLGEGSTFTVTLPRLQPATVRDRR
jgi:PAS domain S-box-containing protein